MKKSDTLFRHKAALLNDTGASIREMVNKITAKTNKADIDLAEYANLGVCERVGTWVEQDGKEGWWELFDAIYSRVGGDGIYFAAGLKAREMYEYTLDELIYLHDEIEKIYKFVVKK